MNKAKIIMDEQSKNYLLDQSMTSVASFAAASRMARRKLDDKVSQPGVGDMSTEDVLKYLLDFMDAESEKMFKEYDSCFNKQKVSRDTTYIELIPEAPFNPEDKEGTIEQLRWMCKNNLDPKEKKFHLIQVYDDKGKPKFITIDEFEKNYYEYWEPVLRMFDYTEEQIEKFKRGEH